MNIIIYNHEFKKWDGFHSLVPSVDQSISFLCDFFVQFHWPVWYWLLLWWDCWVPGVVSLAFFCQQEELVSWMKALVPDYMESTLDDQCLQVLYVSIRPFLPNTWWRLLSSMQAQQDGKGDYRLGHSVWIMHCPQNSILLLALSWLFRLQAWLTDCNLLCENISENRIPKLNLTCLLAGIEILVANVSVSVFVCFKVSLRSKQTNDLRHPSVHF